MTLSIIVAITMGIMFGIFVLPESFIDIADQGVNLGLCIMLFFVGIDIGRNKEVFHRIKKMGWKVVLIPISIAIGSIVGAGAISFAVNLNVWEAAAVGAGMGWYSLSAVILDQLHSTQLGAIGFLSNVLREVLAIIIMPLVARYTKDLYTIAPAGATAMDTTLPIIARCTTPEIAILAFISGVILSMMIPFLVPFFIQLV